MVTTTPDPMPGNTMTSQQVAALLGVKVHTVYRLVKRGRLIGHPSINGVAIDPASVERYRAERAII